jgi:hypothetical protein
MQQTGLMCVHLTHQALVLHPSCISQKVGLNQTGVKNYVCVRNNKMLKVNVTEHSQPRGTKPKMKGA